MSNRTTTLFSLSQLSASDQGLMDFYCLQHLRCTLLESIHVRPPPQWSSYGPQGDLFTYPLQVTILGSHSRYVDLGVYAHPSLLVQQGPKPDRRWWKKWNRAPFLQYAHAGTAHLSTKGPTQL